MASDLDGTSKLLERWYGGEADALDSLLRRFLPWIRKKVRRSLGSLLRRGGDSGDYVQDAVLEILRYVPRRQIRTEGQFRAILAKIVINTLRDKHDWMTADRRSIQRQQSYPTESGPARAGAEARAPDSVVHERQEAEVVRLALEFLPTLDRRIIQLRDWEQLPFAEIGEMVDLQPDAARMRYRRGLARLSILLVKVRRGGLDALIAAASAEDGDSA